MAPTIRKSRAVSHLRLRSSSHALGLQGEDCAYYAFYLATELLWALLVSSFQTLGMFPVPCRFPLLPRSRTLTDDLLFTGSSESQVMTFRTAKFHLMHDFSEEFEDPYVALPPSIRSSINPDLTHQSHA